MARKPQNDDSATSTEGVVTAEDQAKSTRGTGDPALGTPVGVETVVPLDEARRQAVEGPTVPEGQSALEVATEQGYFGTSPQRIATGRDDKGLSQNTSGVMNQA